MPRTFRKLRLGTEDFALRDSGCRVRVVGGELRSRRLARPPEGVRPTSDRVRESLFGRLGDLRGCRVLDLFAGTGALAIEALSRGAEMAVLVDRSSRSLNALRENLESLGLTTRAQVILTPLAL